MEREDVPAARPRRDQSRLALWRKEFHLSQRQLADRTGVSVRTIQRLEAGAIRNPPLRSLVNCALALNCSLADICQPEWLEWTVFDQRAPAPPDVGRARRPVVGSSSAADYQPMRYPSEAEIEAMRSQGELSDAERWAEERHAEKRKLIERRLRDREKRRG